MPLTSILESFNESWSQLFNEELELLRPIFGAYLDGIHNVGSTSIVGMVAKPEIDILIAVKDGPEISSFFFQI